MIRTRVCDLLGVAHPIVLGGMGSATSASLAAFAWARSDQDLRLYFQRAHDAGSKVVYMAGEVLPGWLMADGPFSAVRKKFDIAVLHKIPFKFGRAKRKGNWSTGACGAGLKKSEACPWKLACGLEYPEHRSRAVPDCRRPAASQSVPGGGKTTEPEPTGVAGREYSP